MQTWAAQGSLTDSLALLLALSHPPTHTCRPACLQADYLSRDALHCGVKVAHDWQRLVQFSKVGA